jgi:hypothetical protein
MKKRKLSVRFFAAALCWLFISACVSSPAPGPEPDTLPFEPGVYSSQAAAEELYLSAPANMSGTCAVPGTDKTGTYFVTKSVYTDSHDITFRWSDGSTTSAFVSGSDRTTLRFGTADFWLWVRSR